MADYSHRIDRDFSAGDYHGSSIEFIKVYLPDQSRERLLFPPAFSKQLKGNIPSKAIFEDLNGKQWDVDVDVDKTEDGVWFGNGWTQFATDSHLKPGNFMVFQYDGISSFEVKIYRNDGCLDINVSGSGNKRFNQETLVVDRLGVIKVKKEETICLEPTTTSQLERSDFDSLMPVKLEGISTVGKQGKSKSGVILSPTSLYFTCVPKPLCVFVWLPRRIVKVIGPKLKSFMLFRDQFGETFPVNIIGRFKGRLGFGKGWKEFSKKHPLGFNEEYLLEFSLSNNGRLRKVVDVRIQDRG